MTEGKPIDARRPPHDRPALDSGLQASGTAIAVNLLLAMLKTVTGVLGHSFALIADGIESTVDVISSLTVWSSLRISVKPPDDNHPYGHGKAESVAGMFIALLLLGTGATIAVQSIGVILEPGDPPQPYTLLVLVAVIITKELLFRFVFSAGDTLDSVALRTDAWHHRSDAITSLAAFIGISVALIGGEGYETADGWAALVACGIIIFNGLRLLRPALNEVMDASVSQDIEAQVREIAGGVAGVVDIEKCRVRKSGMGLLMDIHVTVDAGITVAEGHEIGHGVQDRLMGSHLTVYDVIIHIEPDNL